MSARTTLTKANYVKYERIRQKKTNINIQQGVNNHNVKYTVMKYETLCTSFKLTIIQNRIERENIHNKIRCDILDILACCNITSLKSRVSSSSPSRSILFCFECDVDIGTITNRSVHQMNCKKDKNTQYDSV